jgi:hypothetical protein
LTFIYINNLFAIGGSVPELNSLPSVKTPVHPRRFSSLAAQVTKQLQLKAELFGDPLLSLAEVAAALGHPSYSSIRKLIKSGALKTWRIGKRGHHRVRLSALRALLAMGEKK